MGLRDGREDGSPPRLEIAAVAVAGDADERMAIFGAEAPAESLIPSRTSACRAYAKVYCRLGPSPRTLDYFPCVVELPKPTHECVTPQRLAAALQYSRDLRKRKERDSDDWLDAREVVKRPRVKKPTGFKEPTWELFKKVKKRSMAMSKTELKRRRRAAAAKSNARKKIYNPLLGYSVAVEE